MLKDGIRDVDLAEAQAIVENVHHAILAQEGRIQLDRGVQAPLLHQVAGDALDLVGRAPVHRREGDRVDRRRREVLQRLAHAFDDASSEGICEGGRLD